MVEQMGLKGGRSLKIPGVKEEKKTDRELRADIDHIISMRQLEGVELWQMSREFQLAQRVIQTH